MKTNKVSEALKTHYRKAFQKYGDTPLGVDWGEIAELADARQNQMLDLITETRESENPATLLDVGCGYAALADTISKLNLKISYFGMDIVSEMIESAKNRHPNLVFYEGDFLSSPEEFYDYIVCNGILTQKLSATKLEMDHFARKLIRKMYNQCTTGIAFNVMNSNVNFQKSNLYYHSPVEMAAWCISELSPRIKIDCSYEPWFEYTMYVYKPKNI